VPQFADFFKQMGNGAELPLATQILVGISTALVSQIWVILGDARRLIVAGVSVDSPARQPLAVRRDLLKVPFVGSLATKFATGAGRANGRDTALRRHSARERCRNRRRRRSPTARWPRELTDVARQVREGTGFGVRAAPRRRRSRTSRSRWSKWRVDGRARGDAQQRRGFLRRRERNDAVAFRRPRRAGLTDRDGRGHRGLVLALYMPLFRLSSLVA
jgi:hypothetical protein